MLGLMMKMNLVMMAEQALRKKSRKILESNENVMGC